MSKRRERTSLNTSTTHDFNSHEAPDELPAWRSRETEDLNSASRKRETSSGKKRKTKARSGTSEGRENSRGALTTPGKNLRRTLHNRNCRRSNQRDKDVSLKEVSC